MRENRVALVGHERDFRTRLRRGADVATQGRQRAESAHEFAGGGELRRERLLEDRALQNHCRFLDEDLRKLRRILHVVETAAPFLRHSDHRVRSGMARDEHGGHGDAVADDGLHLLLRRRARIAVAEDDDVFEVRRGFLETLMRQGHHAAEARQVALIHAGDLFAERFLVANVRHREQPALGAVPEHDAHFISWPQRIQHAEGAVARDLIAIRELHAVHDERDGALGQNLLGIQLHVHRQRGFERRAAIRPGGISLVAAHAHEADAEIAHGAFEQLHVVRADVARREIADEDGVVALHLGERRRESVEAGGLHFETRRAQSLDELRVLLRLDGDDEDARIAAHVHEAGGAIVLRHVVALRLELDGVGVEARIGERLRKRVEILARREIDGLFAKRLFVAIQPDGGALRLVGLDEDFCVEGLAFLHAAGQAQLLHGDVVAALRAERNDIDGHAQRTRL